MRCLHVIAAAAVGVFLQWSALPAADPTTCAVCSAPAATQPTSGAAKEAALLGTLPDAERSAFLAALDRSGGRRAQWLAALSATPAAQQADLAFLIANMPDRDLAALDTEYVVENVALASRARDDRPWGWSVPHQVFRNALLPYACLNERRDHWRPGFVNRFTPMVKDCTTASSAALVLNAAIFRDTGVRYHPTKRPRPDQSPMESIAAGYASCSGLSILLVDACRAVGVPARCVGTAAWALPKGDANGNHAGNHTWVEIWDGQWHVLGASEVSPLDQTWFLRNASMALGAVGAADGLDHRIYAGCWQQTGLSFDLVWDAAIRYVPAEDVTAAYADRVVVKIRVVGAGAPDVGPMNVRIRQKGRLVADEAAGGEVQFVLSAGQSYQAEVASGGAAPHRVLYTRDFTVPPEKEPVIILNQ